MLWARFACWARLDSRAIICCSLIRGRGLESAFLGFGSGSVTPL